MAAIAIARRDSSSREEDGAEEERGRSSSSFSSSSPAQSASSSSSPRGNVLPSHHNNNGDDDDDEAAAAEAEAAAAMAAAEDDGERAPADLLASGFEPPPFTLSEIRSVIPKKCWEKDVWRSLTYLLRDVVAVVALACSAISFAPRSPWILWPLYWFAQGTMFWSLFVLGHDCGHGSFSNSKSLNDLIGHLTHSFILVPYHGWRISHRTHHANHGHVERDESWHPLPEKLYRSLSAQTRITRFSLLSMFVYPLYLWGRSPGKEGSHFDPKSPLFAPRERTDVVTSTSCWLAMVLVLFIMLFAMGPMWIFKVYVVPYWVFVVWLDAVTYLHHHGHNEKVPWYRGQEWSYTRGGLSTIDRDYGWFNKVHHDIGTHVVHHLFPQIPHYHLVEATEAIKPVLGKYYREPEKSGPFPTHLWKVLVKSISEDHYVSDIGDVVFYQTDKKSKHA